MSATTALRPYAPSSHSAQRTPDGPTDSGATSGHARARFQSRAMWDSLRDPAVSPGLAQLPDRRRDSRKDRTTVRRSWTETSTSGSRPPSPSLRLDPDPVLDRASSSRSPRSSPRCSATMATSTPYAHRGSQPGAGSGPGRSLQLRDVQPRPPDHRRRAPLRGHREAPHCWMSPGERPPSSKTLRRTEPVELARSAICPSHYMAVVDLYRATGDEQYLRLAEAFVRVRDDFEGGDDNQDRLPGARTGGRRRPRGARQLPVRRAGRHRRRDRR